MSQTEYLFAILPRREGPKMGKLPKVVRRGCTRYPDPRSKGVPKVVCTIQTLPSPVLDQFDAILH